MSDKNSLLKEISFIKIKSNLPQNISSFFVKNNSIYLATQNGIWFSESIFKGNFQKLNLYNNEEVLSIKLLGNIFYVMKSDGLYLVNIYDYLTNFLELKLNSSRSINLKDVSQVIVNKNKIFSINNNQLISSIDNGKNFNRINLGKNNIKSHFIFPFGDSLYLATNGGLFVSHNNENFFDISLDNRFYNHVTNYKNRILLSSNDGVFELLDNGNIKKLNSLSTKKIYSIHNTIYFITNDGKLFKSEDDKNYIEVYKNGNAYVSIDSNDRQPISYNGYLMKNEISKK